jgi:hypothetical protein
MLFERAALVVGGGWAVALAGRNAFFPRKPDAFHASAAEHARVRHTGLSNPGLVGRL